MESDLKKNLRAIDLALTAGRKRQSPRTGFIHLCLHDEHASDTIPTYENFCFALALFRQKTTEAILEAKTLTLRLLAFQNSEGNFPIYLHEFPRAWDHSLSLKIASVLHLILRDFSSILGAETITQMQQSLDRCLLFAAAKTHAPLLQERLLALTTKTLSTTTATTPEEWFEKLLSAQIALAPTPTDIPYHPHLQTFAAGKEIQEKGEPRPYPIEWALAESEGFSSRLLRDHPSALYAALLFPIALNPTTPTPYTYSLQDGFRLLWGGSKLHSLSAPNCRLLTCTPTRFQLLFDLPNPPEFARHDLVEVALFADISPETDLTLNHLKGTSFALTDKVRLQTPSLSLDISFELLEGAGSFSGQISRANRPAQIACSGPLLYEAFDWRLALRTLRRDPCKLLATIEIVP